MKKGLLAILAVLLLSALVACGSDEEATGEKTSIHFGATAGPYSDMVSKALKPLLEEKGYEVELTEFSDYVQPNLALAEGSIDANLFQHKVYLEAFSAEHDLDLSELIIVPTAPMGLYSDKYDALEDIEDGSSVALANDPTNLARTLLIFQDAGLITVSDDVDPLRTSVADIVENPKNLNFQEIEAGQLPRAVDSVDLAAVPGNFALAAGMDLLDALILEDMPDDYRNRVALNTSDLEAQFAKDILEVIQSPEFEEIIDAEFQGFGKPAWMQ